MWIRRQQNKGTRRVQNVPMKRAACQTRGRTGQARTNNKQRPNGRAVNRSGYMLADKGRVDGVLLLGRCNCEVCKRFRSVPTSDHEHQVGSMRCGTSTSRTWRLQVLESRYTDGTCPHCGAANSGRAIDVT